MSKNNKNSKGYKGNQKSKGNYRKDSSDRTQEKDLRETKSDVNVHGSYDSIRSNDIGWWNQSPMYPDAVRVPFNRIVGDPIIENGHILNSTFQSNGSTFALPGILVTKFIPSIGSTTNGSNSPVNRAFTSLYGSIYSKTTGAMQFQQADLALFMTGLTSIANLIALGKRMLGVSQLYNGLNYYYPHALLKACGFDPADVIGHQDELRMKLNDAILSFNNLKVPDFMSVYKRQYALCHNVYADEDDVTAQLYLFKPEGYYTYVDTESKLKWSPLVDGVTALFDALEETLTAWRNSSDLGLISGSIQRAFSEAQLISLDYVTSAEVVLPTTDRNIMWQLNNSIAIPMDMSTLDITQDPVGNCLVFNPKYSRDFPVQCQLALLSSDSFMLNSFDGQTDDEFVMEATRLMPAYRLYPSGDTAFLGACNTEIVTGYEIWYNSLGVDGKIVQNAISLLNTSSTAVIPDGVVIGFNMLSKVRNAPRFYLYSETEVEGVTFFTPLGFVGDVNRYTTIDSESLRGLNEAALQSVYATITV